MTSAHTRGLVVMKPPEYPDIKQYLNAPQMTELYGLSMETFYNLRTSPWLLDPDVRVGRQGGWSLERAIRWGRETGRLDENNNPAPAHRRGKPRDDEEPASWYRIVPEQYMSGQEASLFMGFNKDGMFRLKRRNDYPEPAVRIGGPVQGIPPSANREVLGWDKRTCLRFARRRGFLTAEEAEEKLREISQEKQDRIAELRRFSRGGAA